jgi:hypothetical protein
MLISLKIDLKASANGCKSPQNPTIFGPLLLCIAAKTFLSKRVKNAIDTIIGTIIRKDNNMYFIKKDNNLIIMYKISFNNTL